MSKPPAWAPSMDGLIPTSGTVKIQHERCQWRGRGRIGEPVRCDLCGGVPEVQLWCATCESMKWFAWFDGQWIC